MARRAHVYPQVDPGARGVVDVALAGARPTARVGEALRLARKYQAGVMALDRSTLVLREDLSRASALGLDDLPAAALARPLPRVDGRASEISVRRRLAEGAPCVVVEERSKPIGAVSRGVLGPGGGATLSMAARVGRLPERVRSALAAVGAVAGALGARAFLVGGLVRDLWLAAPIARHDLDIVVEGDGLAVARALALALGGSVVEHARFLTASVEGRAWGRVDVATARSERYEVPGALPRVMPATIGQDLRRRDFAVNAMAIELVSDGLGLLDPHGGRGDIARGRLRILHPLSFVEDPTRILRAARYAARFGWGQDAWTARAQALALGLVPYGALSGQRILAELERIVAEPSAPAALVRLGGTGAFRLLDARYRFTRRTRGRIGELPRAWAWARARGLGLAGVELALVALLGEQPPEVALTALRRLAVTGDPLQRLARALEGSRAGTGWLLEAAPRSEQARRLRDRSPVELGWLWLAGDGAARARLDWFVADARDARSVLDGEELIALGVPRGPQVARVLGELRDRRLDGLAADRATAADYVRGWVSTRKEG
ncbi:MAG: CCA tRNA nucleotidyltransferase [Candidatus Rokubacteria bacterium]|nr:CCA tRNA nucleotidyltransferase [Candidatus Rokubacteria bacterium]